MTLKQYFKVLGFGVLLALVSLIIVITQINPQNNSFWGPALFYTSFFFVLAGIYSIGGFVWRVKILKQTDLEFRQVKKTFRQGCLFGAVFVISLFLQHLKLLRWWSILLLIACALGIELRSLLKKNNSSISYSKENSVYH